MTLDRRRLLHHCATLLTALAACSMPLAAAAASPRYRITDLGVLPTHEHSQATAINAAGAVVGVSQRYASADLPGERRGFYWSPQTGLVDLSLPAGSTQLDAAGLSDDGLVVGSYTHDADFSTRAFYWTAGAGLREIPRPAGGFNLQMFAISGDGRAVGVDTGIGHERSVEWRLATGLRPLGAPDGAVARAVNDRGQAAGQAPFRNFPLQSRPLRFERDGSLTPLGSLPHDEGSASDGAAAGIDDAGRVVGSSAVRDGNHQHAFLWTPGAGMQDLGTLPRDGDSFAMAINKRGQVVGASGRVPFRQRMFLWTAEDGMLDLNALVDASDPLKGVARLDSALAINDSGQIAGYARIRGALRAVVLTPLP